MDFIRVHQLTTESITEQSLKTLEGGYTFTRKMSVPKATDEDKLKIIANYDGFIFDLDGTLWRGSTLIDGAKEVIDLLRAQVSGTDVSCMQINGVKCIPGMASCHNIVTFALVVQAGMQHYMVHPRLTADNAGDHCPLSNM